MQVCRYANMHIYASMQVCKYANMQVCKYASMHRYASMQLCKYTQVCKYAIRRCCCMSAVAAFFLYKYTGVTQPGLAWTWLGCDNLPKLRLCFVYPRYQIFSLSFYRSNFKSQLSNKVNFSGPYYIHISRC